MLCLHKCSLSNGPGSKECLAGGEATQVERIHRFGLRLYNLERGMTIGALSLCRAKVQERPLRE